MNNTEIIKDLFVNQGADYSVSFTVANNGIGIDITNSTLTIAISRYEGSSPVNIATTFTKTAPLTGQFKLSINATNTSLLKYGRYVYTIFANTTGEINVISQGQILVKNSPAII